MIGWETVRESAQSQIRWRIGPIELIYWKTLPKNVQNSGSRHSGAIDIFLTSIFILYFSRNFFIKKFGFMCVLKGLI